MFAQRQFTEGLLGLFNTKLTPIPNWSGYIEALKYAPVLKVLREIVTAAKPWRNYASKEPFPEYSAKMETFYRRNLDEIFEKIAFEFNSDYLTISKVEKFLEIMMLTKQQEQSRESMIDEGRARVVCSTIHKSKGLEYYAVMLPYMNQFVQSKGYRGQTDLIVLGNDIGYSVKDSEGQIIENNFYRTFKEREALYRRDEEARILYVAMTRAKKRLVYFDDGGNAGSVANPKNWAALLRGKPAMN
jgi:ATP-dependent exoDNAse (exonuclease V) beta subunit